MTVPVTIDTADIEGFANFFALSPQRTAKALSLSINDTMRSTLLPEARKLMYEQVSFPNGYLDDTRLSIDEYATPTKLRGKVAGRDRPTSLARFSASVGKPLQGQPWLPVNSVVVKPGSQQFLLRAYLVPLKSNNVKGGPMDNVGLAIRLRPGEQLHNVRDLSISRELFPGSNIYLLYGPSVDQIFSGVAHDIEPIVMDKLISEFYRQFFRLAQDER